MAESIEDLILCECCKNESNLHDWRRHVKKYPNGRNNRIKREKKNIACDALDNEQIPCEFCNAQISIDDWRNHSEKCTDANRKDINDELINVFIPCEYCETPISVHNLLWHTKQCADEYKRRIIESQNNESAIIPCEYCNAQVSIHEWEQHMEKCIKADEEQKDDLTEYVVIKPSNELIPCEYCEKLYSVQKIESHQKECRHQQISSVVQSDAPYDHMSDYVLSLPKYWNLSPRENLTRYVLLLGTPEYKFVADNFHKTLPSNKIIVIERIQNRRWYRQYAAHKEDFIERYGKSTEQWLFHGCRKFESAEAIIHDCFNRSHAVNCAVGQGIYFATDAATSHQYAQPNSQKLRHMFMARVLIGRTTSGNTLTRVCPSGFDTTGGGNIFVIYHDAQAYGEYLIIYE